MDKLLFGTAGIPARSKGMNTMEGIKSVKQLGLDAMELEFVRSVNISKEKAPLVGKTAKDSNILLTCHGQYYVNLNAKDKEKLEASKQRMINAAMIAGMANAYSVCFHMGFYLKDDSDVVYERVKSGIKEVVKHVKDNGIKIWIRPELTGKASQFGNLDEVIKLSQDIEEVLPCIDFAHLHARHIGKFNSYQEWEEALEKIEKNLGREALNNMHIHVAGIRYGNKGEINHLNLKDSDLNYKELVRAWKVFKIKGVVISESPNIEVDALMLKRLYGS